jgi:hydroxypyruvate isomerase
MAEDLNKQVAIRREVIHELMQLEGIPPDIITAVALLNLGIQLHYDHSQDVERLAHILEQWADGIRHGQFLDRPISEPKRRKRD